MNSDDERLAREIAKKEARKAKKGGRPKLVNIPRNWLHQAFTYMDSGERGFRVVVELVELAGIFYFIRWAVPEMSVAAALVLGGVVVHTWNWVTNGLFWVVIIQTFPQLTNPGAINTVRFIGDMSERLKRCDCITGLAVYGSVSRGAWHSRSDIDMRILRRPGLGSLIRAAVLTMRERFYALLAGQPMDVYLADDTDFLTKLRADETPLLLIKRDERLERLYPGNAEAVLTLERLTPTGVR